jgi:Domain of unknown function (DUF1707)
MLGREGKQRRVSDLDRERAEARVEELVEQGFVRDEAERDRRLGEIRKASEKWELDAALDGLDAGRKSLKDGDRRAAEGDRVDALRRLESHRSLGHLDEAELGARRSLVAGSKTPNEIEQVFRDLPGLDTLPDSAARRIASADRVDALARLVEAEREGRIDATEHEAAAAQVRSARTEAELDAAFRGLPGPTPTEIAASASIKAASYTAGLAAEGGRRAKKAFLRSLFAGTALLIGVILLIAGIGTAALLCFVASVLLFAFAGVAVVSRG